MLITQSRHTPGLSDGRNLSFNKGEIVTYRTMKGEVVEITIDSDLMSHNEAPGDKTGYESIFHDDGSKYFAARQNIIKWEKA